MYDTEPVISENVPHWTDHLSLDSTIAELKLNLSEIDVSLPGKQLLKLFNHDDRLPGVILLRDATLSNYIFKVSMEALMTPVTYAVVNFLKRAEHEDVYDKGTNFNPFIV